MVAGFTDLYGVAWPLLTLGGRRNVAPLYDMCYYSFLIKKAAVQEVLDFTDFIDSRMESVFPCLLGKQKRYRSKGKRKEKERCC
ncbi:MULTISPECIES: hypothetical protein [unclassified Enterobacter]|uniref:hypothetical protein n=1 Tax=unclassified Enterobacter TaxID=2608935 RepID=UPI001CBC3567|nr:MULTISPECIES: hypothetical protein [unclassified Enterobacter]UAN39673.1 hypothetical protein KGP24_16290 [Enterobacter sp. JBIWA008]UXP25270.1 hypothetical protein N8O08_06710 [Enterobacter sp. 155105]